MILGAIMIIALILVCLFILDEVCNAYVEFAATITVIVVLFVGLIYIMTIPFYIGAGYKAELINKEYGTSYTQAQVFYASDVIDTIREIKRTRVEVNGNLLKGD